MASFGKNVFRCQRAPFFPKIGGPSSNGTNPPPPPPPRKVILILRPLQYPPTSHRVQHFPFWNLRQWQFLETTSKKRSTSGKSRVFPGDSPALWFWARLGRRGAPHEELHGARGRAGLQGAALHRHGGGGRDGDALDTPKAAKLAP